MHLKNKWEGGKLNIGYGADEVTEKTSSNVCWEQDGIYYSLFTFSEDMSGTGMLGMAKEIAESR